MESMPFSYSFIMIILSFFVFNGLAVADTVIEGQSICTDLTVSSIAS